MAVVATGVSSMAAPLRCLHLRLHRRSARADHPVPLTIRCLVPFSTHREVVLVVVEGHPC